MATTASISITSDITDSINFSINEQMTMTQADLTSDLEETTGLAQRTFSGSTTQVVLLDVSTFGAITAGGAVAHKVYIRNTGTDKTKGFKIFLADTTDDTEEIGTLFGQDWMLMPWLATDANEDIMVQPSSTEKMTIEYAVFHQ
jgi:hypothetical protein|tara:strand:+ start:262 stop:693 length:432 start_codon:yes stop_codon:yes gene_type:complete